jgi:uracil-DNA glycosylase
MPLFNLTTKTTVTVRITPSWQAQLADIFDSPQFAETARFVREQYATHEVYPPASKIFAAFDNCPFDQVKVVILGQDPYHGPGQANGLCFSVNPDVRIPPSLINIFKEINADTGAPIPPNGDLQRWARQGVLLLNATLTVQANMAGSHQGHGWEEFTDEVIRRLSRNREHLVFILWGSYAIRKSALIDPSRHLILTSPHPSPLSAHRGFFGNHHFSRANAYLTSHGLSPINW